MANHPERIGYEFSKAVKEAAKWRADGKCEFPEGCDQPNDGTVDHFTGIMLGKLLGMDRTTIKSLDNAQMLCSEHNFLKTREEAGFIKQMEFKLGVFRDQRGRLRWSQTGHRMRRR